MARRNLVLTLSLLSVLTATAGCAEMGKVRVAGSSVDPNAPVNVAPNINCGDISDVLTGRMPAPATGQTDQFALEISCATRPSGMSYADATSDEARKIRKHGWPFMSEAHALVYDASGNVVATAWAGIGHRQRLTETERSAVNTKLGEALAARLLIGDPGGQS